MGHVREVGQQEPVHAVVGRQGVGLVVEGPVVQVAGKPGHAQQLTTVVQPVIENQALGCRAQAAGREGLGPVAVVGVGGQPVLGHGGKGPARAGDRRQEGVRLAGNDRALGRLEDVGAELLRLGHQRFATGEQLRVVPLLAHRGVESADLQQPAPAPGAAGEVVLGLLVGVGLGRPEEQPVGDRLAGLRLDAPAAEPEHVADHPVDGRPVAFEPGQVARAPHGGGHQVEQLAVLGHGGAVVGQGAVGFDEVVEVVAQAPLELGVKAPVGQARAEAQRGGRERIVLRGPVAAHAVLGVRAHAAAQRPDDRRPGNVHGPAVGHLELHPAGEEVAPGLVESQQGGVERLSVGQLLQRRQPVVGGLAVGAPDADEDGRGGARLHQGAEFPAEAPPSYSNIPAAFRRAWLAPVEPVVDRRQVAAQQAALGGHGGVRLCLVAQDLPGIEDGGLEGFRPAPSLGQQAEGAVGLDDVLLGRLGRAEQRVGLQRGQQPGHVLVARVAP